MENFDYGRGNGRNLDHLTMTPGLRPVGQKILVALPPPPIINSDRIRSCCGYHQYRFKFSIRVFRRSRNNSSDSLASMSSLRSVPDDVNSREFKRHTGLPNTDRRGSSPAPGHFRSGTASPKPSSEKNCKNLLQEFCQREGLEFPSYVTNDEGSKGMKPL